MGMKAIPTMIRHTGILFLTGAYVSFHPVSGVWAEMLTDARKKEIVYGMYADYKKDFSGVQDIAPQEAMALLKSGEAVFVDVRKSKEMKVSMLPRAISKEAFLKAPSRFENKIVIGYCTISYRSGKFAQKMAKRGITLYNLTGGLLAWILEGGSVYDENGETRRIHVYGRKWNYPAKGYEAVW